MAGKIAGIIFSNLNDNTLSKLTKERTVAAIPFACRYRLIDFCLSNMINAGVSSINIVANYNYRSLVEHIGSGKDFDLARRNGGINIISPLESGRVRTGAIFETRMEALFSMVDYINEFREKYVALMDSDIVLNIDLNEVVNFHEKNGASVTIVTALIDKSYTSRTPRMMIAKNANRIIDISMNTSFNPECPELCLNIFIMKTDELKRMINLATIHGIKSLSSVILKAYRRERFYAYSHQGYAATVSSLHDYYKYSIELDSAEYARKSLLGKISFPIYTRVKNSAPTSYTNSAEISDSIIADDCIIEGCVKNSVIFRGVHIAKGAIVTNSILFHGTSIEKNARINCIITDKNVSLGRDVFLSGNSDLPFYIEKNKRIIN